MATDGSIKIAIEVDGKQVDVASKSLDNLESSGNNAGKGVKSTEDGLKGVGQESTKAGSKIKQFATALGLVAIGAAAFRTLKASMDTAIARFDTLSSFPKVLQALGVSAEDSQRAMSRLSDGIDGLPTTLNEIASTAQRMYTSFNDIDKATDTALALNNAMLGSGSSAADAQRGTEQYLQALQKGKFEMEEWKTLQETMDVGLIQIAEGFGFAGRSAKQDLYAALKDGVISLDEFNDKLIEVGTGTGVMASLAKENSLGIATSLGNLKNAAAKGIANIIGSFDKLSEEVTGKDIAQNIDSLKAVVNSSFKVIGAVIEGATPTVIFFASTVQGTIPIVKALSPAIIGLMAAYGGYVVITKASAAIQASNAVIAIAQASQKGLTLATNAQIASKVAEVAVEKAVSAAKAKGIVLTEAQTAAIAKRAVADKAAMMASAAELGLTNARSVATAVLTGKMTISAGVTAVLTAATTALGAAIKFLMGPIGWVVAGIGLLVTGVIALVKWFNKSTEEGERLAKQTDELANSTVSLNTAVEDSSRAYASNQKSIESNAQAYKQTLAQIEELSAKENKSAEDKKLLNSYIEELNRNVTGLNLVYGEQSNALNMTSEQIMNRINLMKEEQKLQASQERLTEIMKEQSDIGLQFREVVAQREEWNQKLADGSVKTKEHKEAIEALEEQEAALSQANTAAGEERIRIENEIIASSAAVTAAMEQDIGRQLTLYDELSDSAKSAVESMNSSWNDYKESATDMFDTLSDKSKLSVADMQKNLEENQRIITTWSENIAKLAERGVDEGLLNTLRDAGPESAGHVNALVKASDEELKKLSDSFSEGGKVATEALQTSLGIEDSGLLDAVGHLVTSTEKALAEKIKTADWEDLGVDIAKGQAKGIEDGTPEAEKAATAMAKATEDAAREQLETHSPSKAFTRIGSDTASGLALGITDSTPAILIIMKKLAADILKPFDNTPTALETVGKEAMAGMNRGLQAGKAQVMKTARSIANSVAQEMRKSLDIHSPSRVTRKIGEETGEGLNIGLRNKQSNVNATSKKMAESVAAIIKQMHKAVKDDTAKHNEEIKVVEKRAKEDINIINAKATKAKRALTQAEAIKISRITENANKKIAAIEEKAGKEREKIAENNSKALIEIAEKYVKQKVAAGEMNLKEEVHFWNEMKRSAQVGSVEYERALQNHQNVVKQMRSEMERTNADFAKRMTDIEQKRADDTKRLNDEISQAYSRKVNDLLNFVGLLDEFVEKENVTGQKLIQNMQSQVNALEEFSVVIALLGGRIDNDALFEELQALGPKSLAELRALNMLSDSELQEFANLYERKFELARNQANKELEPLKEDIAQQIRDLNEASQKELEIVEAEWKNAIKKIVFGTKKEFDSMNQVGKDAIKGLENGMMAMEPALMATAKRIADSIKSTIKSALDIHSPSRVMRDEIGRWIPQGIALGIKDNAKAVYAELENMAGKMIIPATPEQALGTSRMAYSGGVFGGGGSINTSIDRRKTFAPRITNHFTSADTSPSQVAREEERMLRKLGLGF